MIQDGSHPLFNLVTQDLVINHDLCLIDALLLVPGERQVPVLSSLKSPLQLYILQSYGLHLGLNHLSLLDVVQDVLKKKSSYSASLWDRALQDHLLFD